MGSSATNLPATNLSATNLNGPLGDLAKHRYRQRDLSTSTTHKFELNGRKVALTISVLLLLVYSQVLLQNVSSALLVLLLSAACHHDWSRLRIPNSLTYPAIVAGLAVNLVASLYAALGQTLLPSGLGAVGIGDSMLGLLIGFGAMAIVFAITGKGAGDVKLAAALGSLTGAAGMLTILVWSHLLAAAFVALWVLVALGPMNLCRQLFRTVINRVRPGMAVPADWQLQTILAQPVPMAGFFALATLISRGGSWL